MAEGCFLARFSDRPCEGALVRTHLIEQQKLAKTFPGGAFLDGRLGWVAVSRITPVRSDSSQGRSLRSLQDDPGTWVWACGGAMGLEGHHGDLDGRRSVHRPLRVPRVALPEAVELFAATFGLEAYLERKYGLA